MDFVGHLAFALFALAYALRDMLWLRTVTVTACCIALIYYYNMTGQPLWIPILWTGLFLAINAIQIVQLLLERRELSFSEEEQELYQTLFAVFSPFEFMKLMRLAQWQDYARGSELTREGSDIDNLILIYNGNADVWQAGKHVASLRDGDFIGEMSFTRAQPASASVVTSSDCRVVEFDKNELRHLMERNPTMLSGMRGILGIDMANKLSRHDKGRDSEAEVQTI